MPAAFPIRLYRATPPPHVAVVSVQPSTKHPGQFLVQVAKGLTRDKLSDLQLLGPFTPESLDAAAQGIVDTLISQGFSPSGAARTLAALDDANPRKRSLAAIALAFKGERSAIPKLIEVAKKGKQDVSTAVDALGLLNATGALDVLKAEAERKLLSRRRAGAEALRNVGDAAALEGVRTRALERLDEGFRKVLLAQVESETRESRVAALVAAFEAVDAEEKGNVLDNLYELGSPLAVAATRAILVKLEQGATKKEGAKAFVGPRMWRYVKSVWKRSMLRFDFETFGPLTVTLERVGRDYKGTRATLKSGLDGEKRKTTVFNKRTVRYVRSRAWRYLKRLATTHPDLYIDAAVATLGAYRPEDDGIPGGDVGVTGRLYLLHRVLLGKSGRFFIHWHTLTHHWKSQKPTVATSREDAFPELWDLKPAAYVKLLSHGRRRDVVQFGLDALRTRASGALAAAPHGDLVTMLASTFDDVVALAVAELSRRFRPEAPDWTLLESLGVHPADRARSLAGQWLRQILPSWIGDAGRVALVLTSLHPRLSAELAPDVVKAIGTIDPATRRNVATRLLAFVRAPELGEGAHEGAALVLRDGLLEETASLLGVQDALTLLHSPSPAAAGLAAAALERIPGVLEALGWDRVAAMVRDEKASLRRAATSVVRANARALAAKPGLLYEMVESDWDDVRAAALSVFAGFTFAELTFDGLVALLDSPRIDVQDTALARLRTDLEALDTQLLLNRLAQHPHEHMRTHVLDLVEKHLKPGFVQLSKVEALLRSILFDAAHPSRALKVRTIRFLELRGLQDENQAEVAARILADVVRTETRRDRELVLQALVKLGLKHASARVTGAPIVGAA